MTPTGWLHLDKSGDKHLTPNWGGEKVGHKPGSVLSTASSFWGQLSIWDACYQTPQAVPKNGTGKKPTIVPPTLLPTGVYLASTSRCCWCALTAPLHPYPLTLWDFRCSICDAISNLQSQISNRGAVSFCGTILTIARTGRYPASLVFREPGLSSDQLSLIRNRLRLLFPQIYCTRSFVPQFGILDFRF